MVFNSLHFVAFFAVVYPLYRMLPHRAQNWMLVAASYYFYAAWDWRFLGLLIGSTVIDFSVARYLDATDDTRRRKMALVLSLVFNLGMLGFFKYFNFFEENFARLIGAFGMQADVITLNVILPMGISFYTFMTVSYVIDVYRRQIPAERNLIDFALFVAYFPHLVAGPVLRASLLIPQIKRRRVITPEQILDGLWLVAWGYFQKIFVADNVAHLVDAVFDPSASIRGGDALLAVYAFPFQAYGDFAGYSNIARGISKLMGIELNVNFLFPYLVVSPREFWRHWHISLSTWLRDYLYIPLGGNRGSTLMVYRNLMFTMTLGGLWHGAGWTYILWGVYQGVILVADHAVMQAANRFGWSLPKGLTWKRVLLVLVMFNVTAFGMAIFRSPTMAVFGQMMTLVVTDPHLSPTTVPALLVPLLMFVLPLLVVHLYQFARGSELAVRQLPLVVRYSLYGAVLYLTILFGDFQGAQFIYFQF
jgi:alginate O-acetyltransferase complex protein AlgI